MKQILCNECAAKVRLSMPQMELVQVGAMNRETCGVCRKPRYCTEYEMARKAGGAPQEGGDEF